MNQGQYDTALIKSRGAVQEIREVLQVWEPNMNRQELSQRVIESGALGRSTVGRVKDVVDRAFVHRFLLPDERRAHRAKAAVAAGLEAHAFRDIVFLYTLRTHLVLHDFLVERYWPAVYAGKDALRAEEIVGFLRDKEGTERIPGKWSEEVKKKVGTHIGKTLTDFGFFEDRRSPIRRFRFWRASDFLLSYFLVEAHEDGVGDTAILELPEWPAFGMDLRDRIDRVGRLAGTAGPFLFQYSGEMAQFTWHYETVEEFLNATA